MSSTLNEFRLDDRVVIITGGAGLLGQQYAQAIVEAGGRAVIADIDEQKARQIADDINSGDEGRALAIQVDVSDKKSVTRLIEHVLDQFERIDGLVNNAALDPKFDAENKDQHTSSFEDYPLSLWNAGLSVNITGMFLCAQGVAPTMLAQGRGTIVNISSTYGLAGPDQRLYDTGDPDTPPSYKPVVYSVTKSAALGLTRYLAAYYRGKGIRVNALTPGGVFNDHDEGFAQRYSARTILGRMAERSEYNGALLYLLSDASSYMTGSNLIVDGGWTAW